MNQTDNELLRQIADMDGVPASGAYNIRKNSQLECRGCSENIEITTKEDKTGIDIKIKAGTKGEAVHIPVLITETGLDELVYNDFFIGENCDVDIVAGCGIHNPGEKKSQHDGIHTFYVGKNSKVRYAEKHYGEGEGSGKRIMNPQTIVYLEEGSSIMLDTTQIRGVDQTKRYTKIVVGKNAEAVITEKLLTHADQLAESEMDVILQGEGSSARVISRSVAQNDSQQIFYPRVVGETKCFGHVQCDALILD
ncbi:MAG: SufD family Fe-S cluster assembly protein [Oscillospiraceae bacterium]